MPFKFVFSFFLVLQISIFAVDFDDLKEKQGKVYGSEKDEKYIYDAFFSELESWPKNNPTHSSFHFFWIFNNTDYPKYSKSQFSPFYSLERSKVDKREETNFLILYNFEIDEKSNESAYFFPFYFSGKITNRNYTHLPLLMTSFSESISANSRESSNLIGPFYSNHLKDDRNNFEENSSINPFYYTNQQKTKSGNSSTYFFPILPIIYSFEDEKSSRKNFFWLVDYTTEKDSLNRFFFMPFVFYKKNEYTTIFPIYFNVKSETGSEKTIIPILFSSETKKDKSSSKNFLLVYNHEFDSNDKLKSFYLFPLYFHWKNKISENQTEKSNLFLPLYYTNQIENGKSYLNLFGLYSYETNEKSERMGTTIFPFYFYKKDQYRVIFPIIFKFGEESEKAPSGKTYGLFYYNSWDEKTEETLLANYYTSKSKNENFKTFFPLFFQSEDEISKIQNVGLFLFHQNKYKRTGNYYRTAFLSYHSWKTDKSDGILFFPFYINIDYPNKTNFNLNLIGLANSSSKGLYTPDINLDAGTKDTYKYIDTDISWLYNIFKIETRISTKLIEDLKEEFKFKKYSKEEKLTNQTSPKIQRKKDFTRDNTLNFYGINFLFSALSFERGDSKRHFRILPLTWVTWDEKSKDQLIAAPFFVYFNDEVSKYIVAFPFYANQETPEEKRTAYGLLLKIDEEYKENKLKEHSYIWPIINYYTSKNAEGSRIIPFYRYKRTWNESEENKNTISLLYFSNFYINDSGIEKGIVVSPFWFYNLDSKNDIKDSFHFTIPFYYKTYEESKTTEFHRFISLPFYLSSSFDKETKFKKSIFWTIPVLVFRNRENDEVTWNTLFINNYIDSSKKNNLFLSGIYYHNLEYEKEKHFLTTRWFLPLFYYDRKLPRQNEVYDKFKIYTPFIFYSSLENTSSKEKRYDYLIPPLLYYRLNNLEKDYYNFAAIFSYEKFKTKEESNLYLTPFFCVQLKPELNQNYFFPIYFYKKNSKETIFTNLLFSTQSEKLELGEENTLKVPMFLPILFYKNSYPDNNSWNFLSFLYRRVSNDFVSHGVFPIYNNESKKNKNYSEDQNYIFPIYYYKNYKSGENSETNFITIFSRTNEESQNIKRVIYKFPSFVPIVWYKENENNKSSWNFLSLIYSRENSVSNSFGLFPIFGKKSTETSFMNFLAPVYYYYNDETKQDKISELITLPFYYKNQNYSGKKYSKYQIPYFLPFIYNYENENDSTGWNLFSLFYSRSSSLHSSTGFIPFYHFSTTKNQKSELAESYSYLFPYFQYEDKVIEIKNVLGILYHQNYSKLEKSNSISILYPLIHSESAKDKFKFQNLFGLIEYNTEKEFSDFNFFWFGYKNNSDSNSLNLFPAYYSKDTKEEKTKLVLPLLTYTNNSKTEEFQSTGLSILYHSKKDLVTKEEDTFWLLGILYYKINRPSERGYEGQGSLWGVLWEYKTESETNYKKFSILKIITIFKETK